MLFFHPLERYEAVNFLHTPLIDPQCIPDGYSQVWCDFSKRYIIKKT